MDTDPNSVPHTTAGLFIEESDDEEENNNEENINTQELIHTQNTENIIEEEEEEKDDLYSSNDGDDHLRISEAITLLTIAWRNEKLAPEILQYEDEVVDRIKIELDIREDEIDDSQDEIKSNMNCYNENKIKSSSNYWFKKEIERIKYILHSYLRIRIWKIQKYTLYLLTDTDAYNNLSAHEQQFAQKYSDLNETHFKNCFLRELPSKYQKVHEEEMCVKPNLNKFVVMKSNVNNDNILIEDGKHHINLQKGNIFVARYKNFKHLVADGR
eukprot:243939_1